MLIPKKIEKNKLILYISIIVIMLASTGFFLYKNYSLTSGSKTLVMEAPAESAEESDYNLDNLIKEEPEVEKQEEIKAGEETSLVAEDKSQDKEVLDFNLLADSKFKKLRENVVAETDFKVGKSNPFVPD